MTLVEKLAIVRRAAEAGAFEPLRLEYYHYPQESAEEALIIRKICKAAQELLGERVGKKGNVRIVAAALWPYSTVKPARYFSGRVLRALAEAK